jgi:hypothetical protein
LHGKGDQIIHANFDGIITDYAQDGIAELELMLANETKSNGVRTEEVALAA